MFRHECQHVCIETLKQKNPEHFVRDFHIIIYVFYIRKVSHQYYLPPVMLGKVLQDLMMELH